MLSGDNGSEWVRNIQNENNEWVYVFLVEKPWFIYIVPPNTLSSPVLLQSGQSTLDRILVLIMSDEITNNVQILRIQISRAEIMFFRKCGLIFIDLSVSAWCLIWLF